jgi:hypothetical protein
MPRSIGAVGSAANEKNKELRYPQISRIFGGREDGHWQEFSFSHEGWRKWHDP